MEVYDVLTPQLYSRTVTITNLNENICFYDVYESLTKKFHVSIVHMDEGLTNFNDKEKQCKSITLATNDEAKHLIIMSQENKLFIQHEGMAYACCCFAFTQQKQDWNVWLCIQNTKSTNVCKMINVDILDRETLDHVSIKPGHNVFTSHLETSPDFQHHKSHLRNGMLFKDAQNVLLTFKKTERSKESIQKFEEMVNQKHPIFMSQQKHVKTVYFMRITKCLNNKFYDAEIVNVLTSYKTENQNNKKTCT